MAAIVDTVTTPDIVRLHETNAGVDAETMIESSRLREVDQPTFCGDPGKLRAHTGWAPRFTLEATLATSGFWRDRRAGDRLT